MNPYIQSLRLRTLPLSVSGIILGSGIAASDFPVSFSDPRFSIVLATAACTALCLQILSNLCNELGDAQKGTDADQCGRAAYGLQSGTVTERQIKGMIVLFAGLSVLSGIALIYSAFGTFFCMQSMVFMLLGLAAVCGAVFYTLGKHSYGYMGLGDLGVFLFFGLLSTIGSYYLQTQTITGEIVWLGTAIGLPCVGVLNLNNIRDMAHDMEHGKHTFAARLGQRNVRIYHTALLAVCLTVFALSGHWYVLCVAPVWAWHLWYVWTHTDQLDKQMPVLMFSTLAAALLALVG